MSKKKTKKKGRELRASDFEVAEGLVVEINASRRCMHGCFSIWSTSELIFRFDGLRALEPLEPGEPQQIHSSACVEEYAVDECFDECWRLREEDE